MPTQKKLSIPAKNAEFLQELKALLEKHNASISFDCDDCSDLQGIYGDVMTINVAGSKTVVAQGFHIQTSDIDERLDLHN